MKQKLATTKLSINGQVMIPIGIRKALKLKAATHFVVRIRRGKIVYEVIR